MPRRVAITIAGAVSLGAYEAGVMYELLEAFRQHNDKQANPDDRIYVDILTGASAGGMTAALLGQRLLFDGKSLQGAFANPLYRTWVERIDIRELVRLTRREFGLEWNSLLSSDLIEKIGRECLIDSMAPGAPSSPPHNTIQCDPEGQPLPLDVGLALTNLDGIDYELPIVGNPDDGFNYTRSDDQRLFHFTASDRPNHTLWHKVRSAAVACGAFPAAFRPQAITRDRNEYHPLPPTPPAEREAGTTYVVWPGKGETFKFVYTDGGVLQNQPLGIAKNFVDDRVKNARKAGDRDPHSIAEDRLYVLVSPHAVKSAARNLRANKITIAGVLVELFHTYIRQATFHDWIVAEGVNTGVRTLDKRASQLAARLEQGVISPDLLTPANAFNAMLLPQPTQRDAALHRLRNQYSTEYGKVTEAKGPAVAEAFLEAITTLEAAAGLTDRDLMKIVAVIADGRTELAGSGISSFVGFFSREFREHDYWMGRVKTRVYLQRPDVKTILNVKSWPAEDVEGVNTWGGPKEDEVKAALPNPTDINTLPMPLRQQLRPGLISILYAIWIRPALGAILILLAIAMVFGLLVLLWLIVHGIMHLAHTLS